jgi:hypothetical protein
MFFQIGLELVLLEQAFIKVAFDLWKQHVSSVDHDGQLKLLMRVFHFLDDLGRDFDNALEWGYELVGHRWVDHLEHFVVRREFGVLSDFIHVAKQNHVALLALK